MQGPLASHEFSVYSHAGEDGIIQFLTQNLPITTQTFVEFGVEDYREANTRFLLAKDRWSGLVMDGDAANIDRIRRDPVFWNSDVEAVAAFVTRENVNDLITDAGMSGDIGLLSVDVDGNDYWIFDAISAVIPAIAIVEYNYRFGPTRSVTIPYDPAYVRRHEDASWLWGGASLEALNRAATRKGLSLVGCNTFGNNAFFVRDDIRPDWLPRQSTEHAFVRGKFRESLIVNGSEALLSTAEAEALLKDFPLVEIL
jgi:hypothetical protein